MKKCFAVMLALCLSLSCAALADTAPKLSYPSFALEMPAIQMLVYAPDNLDSLDSDEANFDMGFRYDLYSDTFDMTVEVHESREMALDAYAAFFAKQYNYTANAADRINGFAVQRLTKADRPLDFAILVMPPDDEAPQAVYSLAFACDGEADVKLANEIMSTLQPME